MSDRLYNYCITLPYFHDPPKREELRLLVKKTALNFSFDNEENLIDAMNAVDTVTEMLLKNK